MKLNLTSRGFHSLTSLMVSRLTEEMRAEAFYGKGWFKLVGSLDHTSDLKIKLITLENGSD